jgi:hypothetical protein
MEYVTGVSGFPLATTATATGIAAGLASTGTLVGIETGVAVTAALSVTTGGLGLLAGVLIFVAVRNAISKSFDYVPYLNIESYEKVLDLAIREAKGWKSQERSDEATMPMEQGINKENELMCRGSHFNLIKPNPFYQMWSRWACLLIAALHLLKTLGQKLSLPSLTCCML